MHFVLFLISTISQKSCLNELILELWLFKFQSKLIKIKLKIHFLKPVTCQVLNSHMEHFHHCTKFTEFSFLRAITVSTQYPCSKEKKRKTTL